MLNVLGEDLCVSSPLINFSGQGILCKVLEYDVNQVLLPFYLFISLRSSKVSKILFYCAPVFFFLLLFYLNTVQPILLSGLFLSIHFIVRGCSSLKFCFRKLRAKIFSIGNVTERWGWNSLISVGKGIKW